MLRLKDDSKVKMNKISGISYKSRNNNARIGPVSLREEHKFRSEWWRSTFVSEYERQECDIECLKTS